MGARKYDINDFNARVKSINNPRNTTYYDQDLGMHVPKKVSRNQIKHKEKRSTGENPVGPVLVSMILGAIGLMIAQIVRIRYFGLTGTGNVTLFLDLSMAVWAIALLTILTGKRKISDRIAQIAGVAVMMAAGHNMIWRWPDQMAVIYTPAYVEQVKANTTQHSIIYRGTVYGL